MGGPDIGCILLVEPFFWPEELWIPQSDDWHPNIQRGRTYDLTTDIGRKRWDDVAERLQATATPTAGEQPAIAGGFTEPVPRAVAWGRGPSRPL